MSNLDKRLRELRLRVNANSFVDKLGYFMTLNDEGLTQIKQAFKDEGWARLGPMKISRLVPAEEITTMLTGQEWYETYVKESRGTVAKYADVPGFREAYTSLLGVAKKASGIDE